MQKLSASSDRLLQLMQLVASAQKPISVNELADASGLPLSTLYRHLHCLSQWGAIQATGESGHYCSGPIALQMALNFQQHETLTMQAMPEISRLSRISNETAALMVATRQQVICVAMIESSQALCCSFSPGKAQALVRGASALSLLAFMPEKHSQKTLNALLPRAEHAALEATLRQVRAQGYAVSDSVIDAGVWGVSAPLLVERKLLGTLTLMAPSVRAIANEARFIIQTQHAARRISNYLDYR